MTKESRLVLPDIIFHKLWLGALRSENYNSYFNMITDNNSSNYINLSKFNFDEELTYEVLKCIYDNSNITIAHIIKKYGFTNASFSHRFCIPISTVEFWVAGKRECPAYLKLLILESLGEDILTNKVVLQSKALPSSIDKQKQNFK